MGNKMVCGHHSHAIADQHHFNGSLTAAKQEGRMFHDPRVQSMFTPEYMRYLNLTEDQKNQLLADLYSQIFTRGDIPQEQLSKIDPRILTLASLTQSDHFTTPEGHEYTGQTVHGMALGLGKVKYGMKGGAEKGSSYSGEFRTGNEHGAGEILSENKVNTRRCESFVAGKAEGLIHFVNAGKDEGWVCMKRGVAEGPCMQVSKEVTRLGNAKNGKEDGMEINIYKHRVRISEYKDGVLQSNRDYLPAHNQKDFVGIKKAPPRRHSFDTKLIPAKKQVATYED